MIRIVVGKPGLDGHSNGAEQIAVAARDAGMEVLYAGIRLTNEQIAAAGLAEWRKLAQGLHARYVVDSFPAAARFVAEVAAVGERAGHHPRTTLGDTHVDLVLLSGDAVHRDENGIEHVVASTTPPAVSLAIFCWLMNSRIRASAAGSAPPFHPRWR